MRFNIPSTRSSIHQGSSLLLVIWAVMLMSISVIGVLEFINYSVDESVQTAKDFQAFNLAQSGITLGLHPQIKPGDAVLQQTTGSDSGFSVTIGTEGSRIALSSLTDTVYLEGLHNLFVNWGLSSQQASTVVDSLADWVDTDDTPRSQGAESDYYSSRGFDDFPRQQSFSSLEELLLVRGMDAVEKAKPDWRNYFSVHGDGIIDLNHAPADIIAAICDVSQGAAESLVNQRNGADGIAGTEDDEWLTLDGARSLLGIDEARFLELEAVLTTEHLTRRVESIGRFGEAKYKIVVIARRQDDGSLNYLARMEE